MASASTHFVVGAALALPALKCRDLTALLPRWALPVSAGLLSVMPDLDLAGRRAFGVRSASLLSHRGLFHSPFFLILFSALLAAVVAHGSSRRTFLWLWLLWAGCAITHPLLDAMTDGGRGVMLLLPFSRARLFFPWRPIYTPPGGIENVLARAWFIRRTEVPFCAAAVIAGILALVGRHSALGEQHAD